MATVLRLAGATMVFATVAAAGHMLNGRGAPEAPVALMAEAAPAPAAAPEPAAVPAPVLVAIPAVAAPVTDVTPTLGTFEEEALRRRPAARLAEVEDCAVRMSATRRGAGLARLAVDAPCRAGERMTVQHDALSFTMALGPDGRADVEVPALAVDAVFFAFFDDAAGAMAEIRLPEVAAYERAGIMWEGPDGLGLHASEFGAPFGAEGYVWAGAPASVARAAAGDGGFITRLGDGTGESAQIAEVYTFPAGAASREGSVEIALEAIYDETACGRSVSATAFRAGPDGVSLVPVSLALPDCDTASGGGYVQLNGTLEPITLAAD